MIKEIIQKSIKEEIARKVLTNLPEWFGIEAYTQDYIKSSRDMPFLASYTNDEAIGFISLKETSSYTAEIYCMGILKKYHHQGYGRSLLNAFESYAKQKGYKFLQVKTVEQGSYDIYDQTIAFYKNQGFYELEVFKTLWDQSNPCQVFVKAL